MKLKNTFEIEEGIRIVAEIDSIERAVLSNIYGIDVCTSKYRIVRMLELFNSLRASMALYRLSFKTFDSGCFMILSEDGSGWNMVKAFCRDKGFSDSESCANHLIDILTEFLRIIAVFQQTEVLGGTSH